MLLTQGKTLSFLGVFFFLIANLINQQRKGILVIYGSLKIPLLLDISLPINEV